MPSMREREREREMLSVYNVWLPLSHNVLFSFRSSGYKLGCTIAAVFSQRPVGHVKNDLQNIMTEGMLHPVVQCTNRAVSKTLVVSRSKLQTQFAWRVHPSKYSLPLRYDGQSQSCLFHHSSTTCSRARGKRDMLYMNSYLS